jgi:hypothetical protein
LGAHARRAVPSSISRRARLTASWRATKLVSAAALIVRLRDCILRCVDFIEDDHRLSKRKVRALNAGANGTLFAKVFMLFMTRKFRKSTL